MIELHEARRRIAEQCMPLPATPVAAPLAVGHQLAQDVFSDVDSPPHDKSLVDGYALQSADLRERSASSLASADGAEDAGSFVEFVVNEEVVAGGIPTLPVQSGTATRIMTGAPLPIGADAVVMLEQTQCPSGGQRVRVPETPLPAGQHVLRRAACISRGQKVLPQGHAVRGVDVGLLCEVGTSRVMVVPQPRVAVLATGDELVGADDIPGLGQIRNSNGPMLVAVAQPEAAEVHDLGIAPDSHLGLSRLIARGLEYDVLILSGGVSAGVRDLVPQVLQEQGVTQQFHKIRLRPGKPFWFGTYEKRPASSPAEPTARTLVFGLPGNPVSALVCFELLVRPALRAVAGKTTSWDDSPCHRVAEMAHSFSLRGERLTYYPAKITATAAAAGAAHQALPHLSVVAWQGSADLHALSRANALARFPAGEQNYAAGDRVEYIELQ